MINDYKKKLLSESIFLEELTDITDYDLKKAKEAENLLKDIYSMRHKNPDKIIKNSKSYTKYFIMASIKTAGKSIFSIILSKFFKIITLIISLVSNKVMDKYFGKKELSTYLKNLSDMLYDEEKHVNDEIKKIEKEKNTSNKIKKIHDLENLRKSIRKSRFDVYNSYKRIEQ